MALKALMLKKKIDQRSKALEALAAKDADFAKRESELTKAIDEAEADEELNAVNEEIDALNSEKTQHEADKKALEDEIASLKEDLAKEEEEQDTTPVEAPTPVEPEERKVEITMDKRNLFANMDAQTRSAIFAQEDVKKFLSETRSAMKEKRAITNIGLTIPEVFLGYLRENIEDYSKLLKHVRTFHVSGTARMAIMGGLQEAIWTECCANLNEMSMTFNDLSVDCYKVGGYYAVCNANLEDSDVALASEILRAIGTGIGYALDKAILYGKNTAANNKMPLGIVSRLAQAEQPADYPVTSRAWANLTSHLISLTAAQSKDVALFQNLVLNSGIIDNDFSRDEIVWVMNKKTKTKIIAESMAKNAAGAVVSALNNTMPVISGSIETLNFIPDNVIIAGYFDLYLLVERAGAQFATSEHVRFLQDQTVFKGTARYDGMPIIPEAFMAIGLDGTTPTAAMTFAADTAN